MEVSSNTDRGILNNQKLSEWFDLLSRKYRDGDLFEMPVLSGSMMKELVPGRSVKIKIIKAFRKFRVGDIVVFRQGKKLYSHRILIKINILAHKKIYQKGDANISGSWIEGNSLIGKVIESVDNYGRQIDYNLYLERISARIKAFYHLCVIFIHRLSLLKMLIIKTMKLIRKY